VLLNLFFQLDSLIKATIAGGGVIPHIHRYLMNKVVAKNVPTIIQISEGCAAAVNCSSKKPTCLTVDQQELIFKLILIS
jgi:hypothetical protein